MRYFSKITVEQSEIIRALKDKGVIFPVRTDLFDLFPLTEGWASEGYFPLNLDDDGYDQYSDDEDEVLAYKVLQFLKEEFPGEAEILVGTC